MGYSTQRREDTEATQRSLKELKGFFFSALISASQRLCVEKTPPDLLQTTAYESPQLPYLGVLDAETRRHRGHAEKPRRLKDLEGFSSQRLSPRLCVSASKKRPRPPPTYRVRISTVAPSCGDAKTQATQRKLKDLEGFSSQRLSLRLRVSASKKRPDLLQPTAYESPQLPLPAPNR